MEDTTPQSSSKTSPAKFLIPIAVIIIIIGVTVFAMSNKNEDVVALNKAENTDSNVENSAENPSSSDDSQNPVNFKDGTYTSQGDYVSPGGSEKIVVTLTLTDGVISKADVESKATRPNSVKYQGMFVSNIKPLIVGKKITELNISKVSGSSLTSGGFNDAVEKIKSQARS